MNKLDFEWDEKKNKNKSNQKKHGISFEEAETVFQDDDAIVFDDPDHSASEDRFLILGRSTAQQKICTVSHCYRGEDAIIRIISARKATKRETQTYNESLEGGCEYER